MTKFFFTLVTALLLAAPGRTQDALAPARLVIVTTFEAGRDTGDRPGEFQYWLEREHLTQAIDVPGMHHLVYTDGRGLYALCCGSREEAPLELMIFGQDSRFDLSRTYWLVAGIADADPGATSIGSPVWLHYVVNGDLAYELDSRDAPSDWPYGVVPLQSSDPDDRPAPTLRKPAGMLFELNPHLADMAYRMSRRTDLEDNSHYRRYRGTYVGYPLAMAAPTVQKGDGIGSVRYWHGPTLTHWAEDWVSYWTQSHGSLTVADPEDQLICGALTKLAALGRVDFQRVLILRTAAEYTLAPHEAKPTKKFSEEFPGDLLAYENTFRAGDPIVHEILSNWDIYGPQTP